jgi:hypothetical protein
MDHRSKWMWQGHLGPQAGIARHPPMPPWHFAMSVIRGSSSLANRKRWSRSVRSMVKIERPWIYGPIVIDLELHQPTSHPNFAMCYLSNYHWEPTSVVGSRGDGIEGQAVPYLGRSMPKSPQPISGCLQIPLPSFYTINRGMELGGSRPIQHHLIPSLQVMSSS